MPLSEHEQRLLEQIEQGLYAEDPKFASSVSRARVGMSGRRRAILAVIGAVVGLGVVLLALITNVIALGVIGFVLMVGSVAWAVAGGRRRTPSGPQGVVGSSGDIKARKQSGMKERMEDRLRRRFDEE